MSPTRAADPTKTIRHASKLLDDSKRSTDEVLSNMEAARADAYSTFIKPHPRLLRPLCNDLGIFTYEDCLVGTTIPMSFRLGFRPDLSEGPRIRTISKEWGGSLEIMSAADGKANNVATARIGREIYPTSRDRKVATFLPTRFGQTLSPAEKLLLLLIEGDMNTNLKLLWPTAESHVTPVFRMRVVTLFHALSTVSTLLERHPGDESAEQARDVVTSPTAKRILSPGGRQVRNRCVHYPITDPTVVPRLDRPMFGLVEAVYPGMTFEAFNSDVMETTNELSATLREWSSC